jgi:ectoine hydroxylase-related dioxygenase (phytanoyl-CoA dioxygenase family)
MIAGILEENGFIILPTVVSREEVSSLIEAISKPMATEAVRSRGGVFAIRNLLELSPAINEFAHSDRVSSLIQKHLAKPAFPVRATLFDKTDSANWLVPWHQDLTICVAARHDVPGYGPWTIKAGVVHVQPPAAVLEDMLSIRIHLDDCDDSNGALRVLPGTHKLGRLTAKQISEQQVEVPAVSCTGPTGSAVLMRPLLLHASSAATKASHRRVLHIDYAALQLDGGLRWASWSSALQDLPAL